MANTLRGLMEGKMCWWMTKKIKAAWEEGLAQGYRLGFQMGQLHAMKKMLEYRKAMEGEPTTLVEKQIEAILQKAEEEEDKNE